MLHLYHRIPLSTEDPHLSLGRCQIRCTVHRPRRFRGAHLVFPFARRPGEFGQTPYLRESGSCNYDTSRLQCINQRHNTGANGDVHFKASAEAHEGDPQQHG